MAGETPTGSIATALKHARALLSGDPRLAEAQAREILKADPRHAQTQLLLATAWRLQGNSARAEQLLWALAEANPRATEVQFELALALSDGGKLQAAVDVLKRARALDPDHPHAWRVLGDQLMLAGDETGAGAAYARHIKASTHNPRLLEAAAALCDNKLAVAERLLRGYLKEHPTDVAAIRMLAETGIRLGRLDDAEALLARASSWRRGLSRRGTTMPSCCTGRTSSRKRWHSWTRLLARDPRNPGYRGLKAGGAGAHRRIRAARSRAIESLLKEFPAQPKAWMSYGHA